MTLKHAVIHFNYGWCYGNCNSTFTIWIPYTIITTIIALILAMKSTHQRYLIHVPAHLRKILLKTYSQFIKLEERFKPCEAVNHFTDNALYFEWHYTLDI